MAPDFYWADAHCAVGAWRHPGGSFGHRLRSSHFCSLRFSGANNAAEFGGFGIRCGNAVSFRNREENTQHFTAEANNCVGRSLRDFPAGVCTAILRISSCRPSRDAPRVSRAKRRRLAIRRFAKPNSVKARLHRHVSINFQCVDFCRHTTSSIGQPSNESGPP